MINIEVVFRTTTTSANFEP